MPTIQSIPYCDNGENYFLRLLDLPFSSWLDSGKPKSQYGRYDIMTAMPVKRLIHQGQQTRILHCRYDWKHHSVVAKEKEESIQSSDPFQLVQQALSSLQATEDNDLPFLGGALGYFSYDLAKGYHGIQAHSPPTAGGLPSMHVGIYHWSLIQDHQLKQAWLVALPECDPSLLDFIQRRISTEAKAELEPLQVQTLQSSLSDDEYLHALGIIDEYIRAGDCYQVNFSQQFHGPYHGSPYSAYRRLRQLMASPFSAYLQLGEQAILSLSPERFLKVEGRQVLTQPIKGTIRRAPSPQQDQQLATELLSSTKNRAENLMIVDLLRNDIGQHCVPGSITVDKLFDLESFPNVHHLVSSIRGRLREHTSSLDLLRDCFPGGSITGAPKKRAMEIIHELEPVARGIYCGSIGYINNNGDMDTNIAIRTVACDGEQLYCSGGGGVVADSQAHEEYGESLDKINTILATLTDQAQ